MWQAKIRCGALGARLSCSRCRRGLRYAVPLMSMRGLACYCAPVMRMTCILILVENMQRNSMRSSGYLRGYCFYSIRAGDSLAAKWGHIEAWLDAGSLVWLEVTDLRIARVATRPGWQ